MSTTTRRKQISDKQTSPILPADTWLSVITSGSGGAMIGAALGPVGSIVGGVLGAGAAIYASKIKHA